MPYSPWNNVLNKVVARKKVRRRERTSKILPIYGRFIKKCH
jgi:hypothetical protein